MKNNVIEERLDKINNENRIHRILLERIEILNKVIEMLQAEQNNIFSELIIKNDNNIEKDNLIADLKKANKMIEKLEQEITEDKQEIEEKMNVIDELKNQIVNTENVMESLKKKNQELNKQLKIVENLYSAYENYYELDDEIKSIFEGIIFDETIETFAISITNESKLHRFYKKISDYVMQNKEAIIAENGFCNSFCLLAKVFDFYFEITCIVEKNISFERLIVDKGDEYDDSICTRIGDPYGKIKDIMLQGYKIDNEIKALSIVYVRD